MAVAITKKCKNGITGLGCGLSRLCQTLLPPPTGNRFRPHPKPNRHPAPFPVGAGNLSFNVEIYAVKKKRVKKRNAAICNCAVHGFLPVGIGLTAMFDPVCVPEIQKYSWNARAIDGHYYAICKINGKNVMMHRLLLDAQNGQIVDHADRNGLNNMLSNIRIATLAQNAANSKIRSDNTSGVKGASWDVSRKKWKAVIGINGKKKNLGRFDTAEAAGEAYRKAALIVFGEFARFA